MIAISWNRYEKIYGPGFVSTGGKETTESFLDQLGLKASQRVLDAGCGIGGATFLMSQVRSVISLAVHDSRFILSIYTFV